MTPRLELAVTEENPNASVLSRRFSQLKLENGILIIKNPDYTPPDFVDVYLTALNDENEQLIMYPEEEMWFLRREQGLEEDSFSFFGLTLAPEIDEDSNTIINIDSLASSETMKVTLIRNRHYSGFDYLYGKVLPHNPHEEKGQYWCGSNYYVTKEEYIKDLRQLEAMTGLKIKLFYLRLSPNLLSSKTGSDIFHRFKLELLMELE